MVVAGLASLLSAASFGQSVDPSLLGGLSYRLVGPFRAGRCLACTGVPGNPDKFYFGAVGGGIWVSENAGLTWTPIFDQMHAASIGAIAVAPSKPEVVYVGSGEADMRSDIQQGDGMYKSTDGGATWAHIGLEDTRQIGKILVDPQNENVLYVAALGHQFGPNEERGVFKSVDGGATWTKSLYLNADTGAIDMVMDPTDHNTLIASMWQTRRPPWEVYPPSSGPGSGLYKSTDAGKTWSKITGHGLPGAFGHVGLSISNANPNRVYAVVDTNRKTGGGVFVSEDKGANWTLATADERLWGRGWYFGGITADPKDADAVYVMNTGMYRSTDGGKTFLPIKGAPGGDDYHTLWINPSDPKRMISATDQGTIVSIDGGKTWSSWWNQPTGQFYHVIADNRFPYWVAGAQQDSGAMAVPSRSNHDHISMRDWRPMSVGGESGTIAADRLHPGTLLDDGGTIERLDDGWHKSVDPTKGKPGGPWRKAWTLPIAASPVDPKVFYTSRQSVFRSGDSGNSWQIISPDLTRQTHTTPTNLDGPTAADIDPAPHHGVVFWLAPSPKKRGTLWAGTDDGLIWLTRDDGKHWENVTPSQLTPWSTVGIIDASHFDADTAYAAIDRHRLDDNKPYIYRTRDGGKHWDLITTGLPSGEFVNVVREDPVRRGLLYAGTDWGVFVSFDDGANWQPLQLNLPHASMRDLVIAGNDLVVGTHGRAIWILDDLSPLRQISTSTRSTTLLAPSPAVVFIRGPGFDDGTPLPIEEPRGENPPYGAMIDYVLAEPAHLVTVRVTDAHGKEVGKASSSDKPRPPDPSRLTIAPYWVRPGSTLSTGPGAHRFVWNFGEQMAPGDYEVALTVDGKVYKQRLKLLADPRQKR
ncbi:Cellulase [Fimbriimonas ginsengisoli Gsoil 348]|uniref:Cellulase n=1 Tax=Fimbriimonas ginsengisoli Gsoil 348 TaxID=661478 RepID=A0A068NKT0_FIMGI|nr:Cellulase [Fimbriimonas ginsengisoli Gsoil 348]